MKQEFIENYTGKTRFVMEYEKLLLSVESPFQKIEIFETEDFGRILVIDGYLMLTEKDEFIYHEMMVHVPMAALEEWLQKTGELRALIIGGGDGGAVRELLRYPEVKRIDLVELDREVVRACQQLLPGVAGGISDSRVRCFFQDGTRFVKGKQGEYDLILIDSTDPVGPGEGLFGKEFYQDCFNALRENGILVNQHESPYYPGDRSAMQRAHERLREIFPVADLYRFHMPSYASGLWMFGFASKGTQAVENVRFSDWEKRKLKTGYYTPKMHRAAFAMPPFILEMLAGEKKEGWNLL